MYLSSLPGAFEKKQLLSQSRYLSFSAAASVTKCMEFSTTSLYSAVFYPDSSLWVAMQTWRRSDQQHRSLLILERNEDCYVNDSLIFIWYTMKRRRLQSLMRIRRSGSLHLLR